MTNRALFEEMQRYLPGGVNSPVRAFKSVDENPVIIERADGVYSYDVEGNRYLDFVSSWGPLILGHNHPAVREAVVQAVERGLTFGAPCPDELRLAKMVAEAVPSIERVRFVSSGTEATMTAVRLARAFTGRDVIVKVAGGYHGHADAFLVQAGSGATTLGVPDSPGVAASTVADTITVPYNDADALGRIFAERGNEIACFIVEPVPGNMGVVPPADGYLRRAAEIVRAAGSLLVFDEVISGFRLGYGGAQERFGVVPDLTTLGKIIGGGMPVGAVGGRAEIMERLSPTGPVYQAGTLSGNPVAMAAGVATLTELSAPGFYRALEDRAVRFFTDLREMAIRAVGDAWLNTIGSVGTLFFTRGPVTDYASAKQSDTTRFARFFRGMLGRGIYLPPSQFECVFVSAAHDQEAVDTALQAAEDTLREIA